MPTRKPVLRRGDRIGIAATGFAVREAALDAGLAELRSLGFQPVEGAATRSRCDYFAGDDEARAADLLAMWDDPDLAAVWYARGGYGTARILDKLDLRRFARDPKPMLGYSDVTALFASLLNRARGVYFHAPLVANLGQERGFHAPSLRAMLAGRPVTWRFGKGHALARGRAKGRVMGGNLTVLVHLLGTAHMPDLAGSILFLEEIGEEAYRLDRLFNHLRMAGALAKVRAVVLGHFLVPPTKREFPPDRDAFEVLRDHLLPLGVPVVAGFPAGHGQGSWTLPLGGEGALDTARGTLTLDPRPVS